MPRETIASLKAAHTRALALHQQELDGKSSTIALLEAKLAEARRRTIPFGEANEINFLPLFVERCVSLQDSSFVELNGVQAQVAMGRRFILTVHADLIDPPVTTLFKRGTT